MAKAAKKTVAKKKPAAKKRGSSKIAVKTSPSEPESKKETGLAPFGEIERIFDELWHRRWPTPFGRWEWPRFGELTGLLGEQTPLLDIVDREKEIVVRAEIPGVEKDDLDVSISDRKLTIKGSSRKEEKEEKEDYFRREIRSGSFSRDVLLPADVNPSKASATFKDGVLELHLPKVRAAKPKKIAVG